MVLLFLHLNRFHRQHLPQEENFISSVAMEFECLEQSNESGPIDSCNESHSFSDATQANSTFSEDTQVNCSAVEVSADDPNKLVAADVQRGADTYSSADEVSPSAVPAEEGHFPTSMESSEENTSSSSHPVINTNEELMTTTSSDRDSSTASPSGTAVDVAPVSVTLTADSAVIKDDACGDVDWRQSNSTESHCSSACSIDTVQSVQRQHVPDNVAISGNVIVNTEPAMTVDDGDQSTATLEQPPSSVDQLPTPEEFVPSTEFTSGRYFRLRLEPVSSKQLIQKSPKITSALTAPVKVENLYSALKLNYGDCVLKPSLELSTNVKIPSIGKRS